MTPLAPAPTAARGDRHAVLSAVRRDLVRYHTGRSGPALGFTWSEDAGGQMPELIRQVLDEMHDRGLIAILPARPLAQRGHRVSLTEHGARALRSWGRPAPQRAAA